MAYQAPTRPNLYLCRQQSKRDKAGDALTLNPLLLTLDRRLMPAEACGYFRVTSPNAAQAASLPSARPAIGRAATRRRGPLPTYRIWLSRRERIRPRHGNADAGRNSRPAKLRIRHQRDRSDISWRSCAGFFRQRIVLALHIADTEIELVLRRCRRRQGGQRPGAVGIARRRWRQRPAGLPAPPVLARSSGSPAPVRRERRSAPARAAAVDHRPARAARRGRSGSGWDRRRRCGGGLGAVSPVPGQSAPERRSAVHTRPAAVAARGADLTAPVALRRYSAERQAGRREPLAHRPEAASGVPRAAGSGIAVPRSGP